MTEPASVVPLEQLVQSNGNLGSEEGESFALELLTPKAICELPDPPPDDLLLGDLIVRGNRTVLGAGTGEGKTTLILQTLAAILEGTDCLGFQGAGGDQRALFLDCEQGLRTIKRRFRERGLTDCEAIDFARLPDGLALGSNQQHAEAIESALEAGSYSVVVADPLYKLHQGDSNAEREAVDLMRLLDRWRTEYHFALLLATHTRKPIVGVKFSIHELFGSSAYTRGAEVVLGLQRIANGYGRLHFLKDRDGDLGVGERWGLIYDHEHGFRRDPKDGKPSTREQVAALRRDEPSVTQAQAAELLDVNERTIRRYWHASEEDQLELEPEG
jgi:hypothetical protein